jgi:acyl-CoA thioester hydrolase
MTDRRNAPSAGEVVTPAAASMPLRIYYEDTDFSGFVYHARYLHFFERGRTEALRSLGIDQRAMHEAADGPSGFVVRRMAVEYHSPARMDDLLRVETLITGIGAASIAMHQRLLRDTLCLCDTYVEIAHVAHARATRMPAMMRQKLRALLVEKTKN